MYTLDLKKIGDRLLHYRNKIGMSQADVADAADISLRTYADIERGNKDMRLSTILYICNVLHLSIDELLVEERTQSFFEMQIANKLPTCSTADLERIAKIVDAFSEPL